MTALSIRAMNKIVGDRELVSHPLPFLDNLRALFDLAEKLQSKTQDPRNRIVGANMEAEQFHKLVEYLNTDPAHVQIYRDNSVDPRPARQADLLYSIENEPLNKEQAIAVLDELAELDQSIQQDPPQIVDGVSSAAWYDAQEEIEF